MTAQFRRIEDRERETEARLLNWARWARGAPVGRVAGEPEERPDPVDMLDAEIVERVLCRMKHGRPEYWRIVEVRYLRRWPVQLCANTLKRSLEQHKRDVTKLLSWTEGALDTLGALPRG